MQLTPVFTHTASEVVFKLLSQIMLQIDTSLKKKTRESLKCPMAKRLISPMTHLHKAKNIFVLYFISWVWLDL